MPYIPRKSILIYLIKNPLQIINSFKGDINKDLASLMNYEHVDIFSVKVLWWHFFAFIPLIIINSFLQVPEFVPSPFGWRILSYLESFFVLFIAFICSTLSVLFINKFKNHYTWRVFLCVIFSLYSYLLVFVSGGSIEMHFHFFIILAYLAIYADWRLPWILYILFLIPHVFLNFYQPEWVYFYGENYLAIISHSLMLFVASVFTSVMSQNHREAVFLMQNAKMKLEEDLHERKRMEKRKDDFISIVSHELKTPLTSTKIFAQLLLKRVSITQDEKSHSYLHKIMLHLDKLTRLIQDLLDVTRMQTGKLELNKEYFDFDFFIDELLKDLQLLSDSHKIELVGKVDTQVYADKERLSQVLVNLVTNAIKYSPTQDFIKIEVAAIKNMICVKVIDKGIGIPKRNQNKIFKRFYRVSDSKRDTFPGLGIGLYISAEIIKEHGGTIWVESEEDLGSTFIFMLPLSKII